MDQMSQMSDAIQDLCLKHLEFAEWQLNNLLTAEREINFLRDRVAALEASRQAADEADRLGQKAAAMGAAHAKDMASSEMRIAALEAAAQTGGQPFQGRDAGNNSNDGEEEEEKTKKHYGCWLMYENRQVLPSSNAQLQASRSKILSILFCQ